MAISYNQTGLTYNQVGAIYNQAGLIVTQAGSSNSTTSSATLVVTLTQSVAVGEMLVIVVAADNSGTNGATSLASVVDSKSNTYFQRATQTRDPGASNQGATVAIYSTVTGTAMTTADTITINFSPNTPSKSAVVWEVISKDGTFPKYLSNGGTTAGTANPSLVSSSIGIDDTLIFGIAAEEGTALTGDSDTTNGLWSTLHTDLADTGANGTSMRVGSQHKTVTATGTQTWNLTQNSADWAISYIVLEPTPNIQRTATGSGTGTQTASGGVLVTFSRTATGSGTGTQTATGVRVVVRTATGSGVGSQTATGLVTSGAISRTATGDGTGTQTATGVVVKLRTATGSGVGSQTATGRNIFSNRTATGSGASTQTASGVKTKLRTATSSGTGTQTATGLTTRIRTAAGSGVGSSTTTGLLSSLRTATGSGTGSALTTSIRTRLRTATGSGTGFATAIGALLVIRSATGSGVGNHGTVTWEKSLIFRPPLDQEFRWARYGAKGSANMFFGRMPPGQKASNIYKMVDGSYTNIATRDYSLVDKVYHGGHENFVTAEEKADLITAGYGDYVS